MSEDAIAQLQFAERAPAQPGRPWPRLFARMLDSILFGFIGSIVMTIVLMITTRGGGDRFIAMTTGVGGMIASYIEPDPGDPQRYVVFALQGGLSLPDESYYRLDNFDATRTAFRAFVQRMLALAGVADADAQADRVMALETELAGHHWDNVRSRDAVATYKKALAAAGTGVPVPGQEQADDDVMPLVAFAEEDEVDAESTDEPVGALWSLGFLLFLWRYTPFLLRARADGKPG